jgi:hypothetical protein
MLSEKKPATEFNRSLAAEQQGRSSGYVYRGSSQLGAISDQPKGGTRDIIVHYCPDSAGRA